METDQNIESELTEDEIKEVYARYGLTAYTSQLFEKELGQFLTHVIQMQKKTWSSEEIDSVINDISLKTLGRILNELRERVKLKPQLENKLKEAANKRNYLAHHFFSENAYKFFSKKGQTEMINELNSLKELFDEAESISRALSKTTRKIIGFDENKIEALANQTIQKELKNFLETGSVSPGF